MTDALAAHAAMAQAYQSEIDGLRERLAEEESERLSYEMIATSMEERLDGTRHDLKAAEDKQGELRRELREQRQRYETLSVQHVARNAAASKNLTRLDQVALAVREALPLLTRAQQVRGMNPTAAANLTTEAINLLKESK